MRPDYTEDPGDAMPDTKPDLVTLTLRVGGQEITYGMQAESLLDDYLEKLVRGPLLAKWLRVVREDEKVTVA